MNLYKLLFLKEKKSTFSSIKSQALFRSFFVCLLAILTGCGQGTEPPNDSKAQGTVPVGVRLLFEEDAKQKSFAIDPTAIAGVRCIVKANGIEIINVTAAASTGNDIPFSLEIPRAVEVNIIAELLDSNGAVLLAGQEKTVFQQSGEITIVLGELISLFANPSNILEGNSASLSLSLSETFLGGLTAPSFTWTIENVSSHSGNTAITRSGSIVTNPADSTRASYTAPNLIPEAEPHIHVVIKASSNEDPTVFKTATLTVSTRSPATFPLTVTKAGTGSGRITTLPSGMNCGATCSAAYTENSLVKLIATPDPGSTFSEFFGWKGDPDCEDGQVTMTAALSCEATFTVGEVSLSMKLTWGANPRDLDAHLVGPNNYHIEFTQKGSLTVSPFARLDVDNTSGFGPEIITVVKFETPGTYTFSVHHFSGTSTITSSPARVELSLDGVNSVFTPPPGQTTTDKTWNVFELIVDTSFNVTVNTLATWQVAAP